MCVRQREKRGKGGVYTHQIEMCRLCPKERVHGEKRERASTREKERERKKERKKEREREREMGVGGGRREGLYPSKQNSLYLPESSNCLGPMHLIFCVCMRMRKKKSSMNLMVNPNVGKKKHRHACPRVRKLYGQHIKREREREEINHLKEREKGISLRKRTQKNNRKRGKYHQRRGKKLSNERKKTIK